jgi:hypothetical protein
LTITLPDVAPPPVRVIITCQGCDGAVSVAPTAGPLPTRCYWCHHGTTPEQLAADSYRYAVDGVA